MSMRQHKPVVLLILDGWGVAQPGSGNAIELAHKPNFDQLWQHAPHALLSASGLDVGLPRGQMGNSEVGHLHIGAGRYVLQELTKLDLAVENGEFFTNPVLLKAVAETKQAGGALHILGLLSDGGVHSRNAHMEAMVELAAQQGLQQIYLHAFLDGRDTPPKSAIGPIKSMLQKFAQVGCGQFATIGGRYYAMDRDQRWERVAVAYELLTLGKTDYHAADAAAALAAAYERQETDEFVKPTAIHAPGTAPVTIKDGDTIIFMNFRADRARELSYAFTSPEFTGFPRAVVPRLTSFVTMTEYAADLAATVAYPNENLTAILGECVAQQGLTQLRIAETEKYAHVTYFINGGREQPFAGEDRILVSSPKVATYDLKPEMSVFEVTEKLVAALEARKYDLIIGNFANPDMVGHTGMLEAAIQAVEAVDQALGKLLEVLTAVGGELVIVADHGNAEKMIDPQTHEHFTAHTTNLVPFIYRGRRAVITKAEGKLIDIAPTILYLLGIAKPQEMLGESMVRFE